MNMNIKHRNFVFKYDSPETRVSDNLSLSITYLLMSQKVKIDFLHNLRGFAQIL